MLELDKVYLMDCLEGMKLIDDKSIDMILCDLPYGRTQNKWDAIIDLKRLWVQYNRIIKDNGAILLFAQCPFDKILGNSNLMMLRYEWCWVKNKSTGFLNAKKMPLKSHENILVFYKKLPIFNPQKTSGHKPVNSYTKHTSDGSNYGETKTGITGGGQTDRYPSNVIYFSVVNNDSSLRIHPTQKPLKLVKYFIKTYSNEGDLVLDNCMGSFTTAVACIPLNRRFVGFENNKTNFKLGNERLIGELKKWN